MSDDDPVAPDEEEIGEPDAAAIVERVASRRAERRAAAQRRRQRRVRMWLSLLGVVIVALFLAGFWPVMQGRLNAAKQLDQADALLKQAEGTVATVDKTVSTQLSADAAPGVPSVVAEILVARRELDQTIKLTADAMPHLTDDEQRRATLIQAAAKARLAMLDNAPAILIASVKAVQSKTLGDQAWHLTTLANNAETMAARNYDRQTASTVESAAVSVTTIKGRLGDARRLYSQAASAFPDAGFERYVSYVDLKRAEIAQLEQAALQWLGGSRPSAATGYASYRTSVAKSSTAARSLPRAPGNATGAAFRKVAGSAADSYASAKQRAAQADRALKDM